MRLVKSYAEAFTVPYDFVTECSTSWLLPFSTGMKLIRKKIWFSLNPFSHHWQQYFTYIDWTHRTVFNSQFKI